MNRRTRGNFRAANQQKDTSNMVINVSKTYQVPVYVGYNGNAIAISIWRVLSDSPLFSSYGGMFDQVRITGIKAKITGLNAGTAITMANTPTICTAWDRNGLDLLPAGNNVAPFTYNTVASSSSAIVQSWSPGNAFKITRRLYPSTMSEKSYYAPCTSLRTNDSDSSPAYTDTVHSGQSFKPVLLIGAFLGYQAAALQSLGFMVEFDISCTFRGLHKAIISSDPSEQLAEMAGIYRVGITPGSGTTTLYGEVVRSVSADNWKYVNNDGDVDEEEVPVAPVKEET